MNGPRVIRTTPRLTALRRLRELDRETESILRAFPELRQQARHAISDRRPEAPVSGSDVQAVARSVTWPWRVH
jgi:hypothetical protein